MRHPLRNFYVMILGVVRDRERTAIDNGSILRRAWSYFFLSVFMLARVLSAASELRTQFVCSLLSAALIASLAAGAWAATAGSL